MTIQVFPEHAVYPFYLCWFSKCLYISRCFSELLITKYLVPNFFPKAFSCLCFVTKFTLCPGAEAQFISSIVLKTFLPKFVSSPMKYSQLDKTKTSSLCQSFREPPGRSKQTYNLLWHNVCSTFSRTKNSHKKLRP